MAPINRTAAVRLSPGRTLTEGAVRILRSLALPVQPSCHEERLSFRELYDKHFAFSWRTLRYLGVPEASLEDAAQDLWMVVHRRYMDFEGRSDLNTWLFGIAINVERNRRRVERRRGQLVELPLELRSESGDPVLENEGKDAWRLVRGFVESLDDTRRAVFVAALLEGLSAAETAEATGLDLTTVYNRVRALRRSFNLWAEQHRRGP
jgi:RNA polymerase sigma-70 factor (ECF subfamily)